MEVGGKCPRRNSVIGEGTDQDRTLQRQLQKASEVPLKISICEKMFVLLEDEGSMIWHLALS